MVAASKKDWRPTFVISLFMVLAAAIVGRLFFLQVSQSDYYRMLAEDQHSAVKTYIPHRGDIFFKDKSGRLVPAATTNIIYTLHARPREITDAHALYAKIQPYMRVSEAEVIHALEDRGGSFAILERGIEKQKVADIMKLAIPGLDYTVDEVRVYPGGVLASQILGFLGFVGDKKIAQYGLEKQYQQILELPDAVDTQSIAQSLTSFSKKIFSSSPEGADIVLTIDPDVQSFVERRMAASQAYWHARSAGALIIEPKTGRIVAMGSSPTFDPNLYGKEKNYDVFINPFVQELHEMGSVFKPLTMAAALDAGVVKPETTYEDAGRLLINGRVIENFDGKARGTQTMLNVLQQSLNTGSVFAMRRLGQEKFEEYFKNYGLAEDTGIDLPGETSGNLRNLDSGREIEFATASFGQGISVSFIELASALSSIINGGELMRPYVVDVIRKDGKEIRHTEPMVRRRVIKKETSDTISRMLTTVVDTTLANGKARIPGYSIGAKTGTAQMSKKDGKGYSDEYLHTYFGFGPAFDPRFLIVLYLEEPQGVKYSSQSLTAAFKDITQFLITYYEIPPDRPEMQAPRQ
jgi:cell division protein FtsI/penicillin-binding protein 2